MVHVQFLKVCNAYKPCRNTSGGCYMTTCVATLVLENYDDGHSLYSRTRPFFFNMGSMIGSRPRNERNNCAGSCELPAE